MAVLLMLALPLQDQKQRRHDIKSAAPNLLNDGVASAMVWLVPDAGGRNTADTFVL
jgi:hypothetical protein